MLTLATVTPYLLHKKLIQPVTVIEGGLTVQDMTRRNVNFKVTAERGPSYLVKQGVGQDKALSVANEAAVYNLLSNCTPEPYPYTPLLHFYDPSEGVLVVELLSNARSIGEQSRATGRFSTKLAAELGHALATLHTLPVAEMAMADHPDARRIAHQDAPWVLSMHLPDISLYLQMSAANLQLARIIGRFPEFSTYMDALRREWRPQSLVHYDIKWENLLVTQVSGRQGKSLRVVDWELAGLGDPCWDVGSLFGEYLNFWLLSIPVTSDEPPERFMEMARYPLDKMQPALRRFWQIYTQRMKLDDAETTQWLLRSVRYAAARLLRTAFEQSQLLAQVTGNALCYLQLAFNMLQRPHHAAIFLLGIPFRGQSPHLSA